MTRRFGPGTGRRGRPTPLWLFGVHLGLVFLLASGTMWAFYRGIIGLGIALLSGWLIAFTVTSADDVRVPMFERANTLGSHLLDRVRRMGDNRMNEEEESQGGNGEENPR